MSDPVSECHRLVLRTHLQAMVPLRMQELADISRDDLLDAMERLWPRDEDGRRDPWVRDADVVMYGDGPRTREGVNRLVDGLAVAALVADGGVTFNGLHWCTDHAHCIEAGTA